MIMIIMFDSLFYHLFLIFFTVAITTFSWLNAIQVFITFIIITYYWFIWNNSWLALLYEFLLLIKHMNIIHVTNYFINTLPTFQGCAFLHLFIHFKVFPKKSQFIGIIFLIFLLYYFGLFDSFLPLLYFTYFIGFFDCFTFQ